MRAKTTTIAAGGETIPIVLRMGPEMDLALCDDKLYDFCRANRDLRIERNSTGDLVLMSPTGGETGKRNLELTIALGLWARQDGRGIAFDSSTGFTLPDGAMRSPDASWVERSRLDALTAEEKRKFLPLAPDFAVELLSPSDNPGDLEAKMEEYLENGTRLGWLLDPDQRQVTVFRPGEDKRTLDDPPEVSGDPLLPGFVLRLEDVWATL